MMAVYTQVVRKYLALALVLEICTTYSRPTGYLLYLDSCSSSQTLVYDKSTTKGFVWNVNVISDPNADQYSWLCNLYQKCKIAPVKNPPKDTRESR